MYSFWNAGCHHNSTATRFLVPRRGPEEFLGGSAPGSSIISTAGTRLGTWQMVSDLYWGPLVRRMECHPGRCYFKALNLWFWRVDGWTCPKNRRCCSRLKTNDIQVPVIWSNVKISIYVELFPRVLAHTARAGWPDSNGKKLFYGEMEDWMKILQQTNS